jgi:membrane-bound lytic murein transglycosylase D
MASARNVLPAETRAYVPKIMAAAILAKHAAAFGFAAHEIAPEKWVEYDEVVVRHATDLATLAAEAEATSRSFSI